MAQYLPRYSAPSFGLVAAAAITGGQLVNATGNPATAGDTAVVGVAGHDVVIGGQVTVFHNSVQRPVAAATITAGQIVKAAVNGQVTPYTSGTDSADSRVGVALTGGAAGAQVDVLFER